MGTKRARGAVVSTWLGCSLFVAAGASAQTTVNWTVSVPAPAMFFAGDARETIFSWTGCSATSTCTATLTPEVPASVVIASVGPTQLGYWSPYDREDYVLEIVLDTGTDRVTLRQNAFFQFVGTGGWADPQWRLAASRGQPETVALEGGRTLDVTLLPWGADFRQVSQSSSIRVELVLHEPAKAGVTIKVTTTADDRYANGNCTLREAIIAANTDRAVDRCPAGSGADRIIVPAGTYLLTLTGPGDDAALSGDLDIAGKVTIRGAGAHATIIDGGSFGWPHADRVIQVLSGAELTLSRVTVRGGNCFNGGGIFNAGTLMVVDTHVRDNITSSDASDVCSTPGALGGGAGIHNLGTLMVTRSTLSGNRAAVDTMDESGGGLLNQGSARLEMSELTGNFGAAGGGIMNYGDLQVSDTQIRSNEGRFWGAGLTNRGRADLARTTISNNVDGGILHQGDHLALRNSTVSGNYSARIAGAVSNWTTGSVAITSSTIAGNRSSRAPNCDGPPCPLPVAGLYGPAHLTNTIVSNPGYGDCWDPVVSLGNNLDRDGSCGLTASGDLPNTDPRLGPLADNGGPTRTHALLPGSPAIDQIPTGQCGVATDQRGVPRPQPRPKTSNCDIGAYEFSPAGDIALLIEDVRSLGAQLLLTQRQVDFLVGWLSWAWRSATFGHSEFACARLDDFKTEVLQYVADGSLNPVVAQGLLDDADRIRALLCP